MVVGPHSNTHTPKEKFPTQKKSSEQTQKTPDPSYSARTVDLKRLVWFSTKVIVNLGWRFHSYTITCLFLSSQEVGTHNFQGVCNDHFTLRNHVSVSHLHKFLKRTFMRVCSDKSEENQLRLLNIITSLLRIVCSNVDTLQMDDPNNLGTW